MFLGGFFVILFIDINKRAYLVITVADTKYDKSFYSKFSKGKN